MAEIAEIANNEAGSSVRSKLNAMRILLNTLKGLTGVVKVSSETIAVATAADLPRPLFARTITEATGTLQASDIGNIVTINRASAVTVTIPTQLMQATQQIGFEIIGAGQLTLAVADGAKQVINAAKKSPGQDTFIGLYCRDHTENAEIYKIVGGVE